MSRHRGDAGQATVEVALAVPLLAIVILVGLQIALVVRDQVAVIAAAHQGARAAAVAADPLGAAQGAVARTAALPAARRTVRTSTGAGLVTVTVTYRSPTDLPLVGAFLPDITVRGAATMAIEE